MEETSLSDFLGDGEAPDAPAEEADDGGTAEEAGAGGTAGEASDAGAATVDAGTEGSTTGTEPDDVASDADAESLPPMDPAAVDPAAATASWRPDGEACQHCGETAGWRWRDVDGGAVCADCLDWDRV